MLASVGKYSVTVAACPGHFVLKDGHFILKNGHFVWARSIMANCFCISGTVGILVCASIHLFVAVPV